MGWRLRLSVMAFASAFSICGACADDWSDDCKNEDDGPQLRLDACTRVIAAGTENTERLAEAYINRGGALKSLDEYDKAVADFDEAIRLQPSADAFAARGLALNEMGQHKKALADLNEVLRLDAANAMAHVIRGWVFNSAGDYDRSLADADEAIRLSGTDSTARALGHLVRASDYHLKGDSRRALADFGAFADFTNQPAITISLKAKEENFVFNWEFPRAGAKSPPAGQSPAGQDSLENIAHGENAIRLIMGLIHQDMKDYDHAAAEVNQVLAREPKMPLAHFVRGYVELQKGDHERAIADFSEAIRLKPDWADAYTSRASGYEKSKNYVQALADLTEADYLEPGFAKRRYNRGKIYESLGDRTNALRDYREALTFDVDRHANASFQAAARERLKALGAE